MDRNVLVLPSQPRIQVDGPVHFCRTRVLEVAQ